MSTRTSIPEPLVICHGLSGRRFQREFDRWARRAWPLLFSKRKRGRVSVSFVTAAEMARINRQTRGRTGATTVLSFPYQAGCDAVDLVGEIFLCPSAISQWARRQEMTSPQAIRQLYLHGLVHLAGHDHQTLAQARRMQALEKKLVALYAP